MSRLGEHPHIVGVLESGEDRGRPYIVSEHMPGGDVASLLEAAEERRLELDRALAIATDVTRALEHAHARGIVHRDLKPANVWLGEDGRARLGDFGLALTQAGGSRAGEDGTLVGTVAYLPPEQALGRAAGARVGPLLARRAPLRDAHRAAAVPGGRRGGDHQPASELRSGASLQAPFRRAAGRRRSRAGAARQATRGAATPAPRSRGASSRPPRRRRLPRSNPVRKRRKRTRSTASPAGSSSAVRRELGELREAVDEARSGRGGARPPGGRTRDRQDADGRGARHLRPGQGHARALGPLPRGRGGTGLLALGRGDPLVRPRLRSGRPRLGAGLGGGRDRADRPRAARAPRLGAGGGRSVRRGGAFPALRLRRPRSSQRRRARDR